MNFKIPSFHKLHTETNSNISQPHSEFIKKIDIKPE